MENILQKVLSRHPHKNKNLRVHNTRAKHLSNTISSPAEPATIGKSERSNSTDSRQGST